MKKIVSGLMRLPASSVSRVTCCLLASIMLAAGCTMAPVRSDASADSVTESDESPERRRARTRLELALGYFDEGRTAVALDEVKQALAHDPRYAPAHNLRGLVDMRLGQNVQAEMSFRRALSIDPREPNTWHNLGWLVCQQSRFDEAQQAFEQALASVTYTGRAKTFMAQGICLARAGRTPEAERILVRSYELDATHPVTAYNLARLLLDRGELARAQFYIRRLNNSEQANAESLWLGIRIEQRMGDRVAMLQLAEQLKKRYPQSTELAAYDKGKFNE